MASENGNMNVEMLSDGSKRIYNINDMIVCGENRDEDIKMLSDVSMKMYDLNELTIRCINRINEIGGVRDESDEFDELCDLDYTLENIESEVQKLINFNTEYLKDVGCRDYYMFEVDKMALDVMINNIRMFRTEPIISILKKKHYPVVTSLPTRGGVRFYCPICEEWHEHGEGDGFRISHCTQTWHEGSQTIFKGGEYMPRENILRNGYILNIMSKDELRKIRDDINRYLGE